LLSDRSPDGLTSFAIWVAVGPFVAGSLLRDRFAVGLFPRGDAPRLEEFSELRSSKKGFPKATPFDFSGGQTENKLSIAQRSFTKEVLKLNRHFTNASDLLNQFSFFVIVDVIEIIC